MREQKLSKKTRLGLDRSVGKPHFYFDSFYGEWLYKGDASLATLAIASKLDKTHNRSNNFGRML
jgi:hypothetical protein